MISCMMAIQVLSNNKYWLLLRSVESGFLVNSYLSQLVPIFGQLVPDLRSTCIYPKSTRTRVMKRGRVEHDRRGAGKSRS